MNAIKPSNPEPNEPEAPAIPLAAAHPAAPSESEDDAHAAPALKKVRMNREDFVFALEGGMSETIRWVLDTETGEVFPLMEEQDDYEQLCDQLDGAEFGRYLEVDRIESHESYDVMEDFALTLPQPAQSRLLQALAQKKPFRRFKDAVERDLHLRDRWFAFRDEALTELAIDWLEAHGIEPVWLPRDGAR